MSPLKLMLVIPATLAAGSALAQEPAKPPAFDAGNYPPEVRKALRYADEECARQESSRPTPCERSILPATAPRRLHRGLPRHAGSPRVRWPRPHLRNPPERRRPHHTLL